MVQTRWPEAECVDDWSQGIPLAYTRELADYWANSYDWRAREEALNRFDHFTTEIDGLDIHFIHQRSGRDDAFPLLITHGWPGSIVEFHKVIEPLTERGFDVVCPSLPGYGFSGKPTRTGWGVEKIAAAWETLMGTLGYERYGAQGGDWGAAVTTQIGRNGGRRSRPRTSTRSRPGGDIGRRSRPGGDSALRGDPPQHAARRSPGTVGQPDREEKRALEADGLLPKVGQRPTPSSSRPGRRRSATDWSTRPVGQLAWIVEKFWSWTDCDGHPENALTQRRAARQRDALLADRVGRVVGAAVLGELQRLRR